MRAVIEAVMAVGLLAITLCAGISIGAHAMESKVPVCESYSQGAASKAIDVLLPHPGEADPVNGDGHD